MKSLLENISIYFLGTVFNRLMGYIVFIISTHLLSKNDSGYFATIYNLFNMILTVVSLQIWMAIIRFIFDYRSKFNKFKIIINGYFVQLICFLIFTVFFIIAALFNVFSNCKLELYLMSMGYVFNQNVQFACRGLEKNRLYVISGIVGSIAQLFSCLIFLFIFKLTYSGLILATAVSHFSQGLFIEFFLKSFKQIKLNKINFKTIKKMTTYSIATTFNFVFYWFNQSSNTLFLTMFLGTESTGIFSAANRMNSIIGLFIMSFNFAFQEFSFNLNYNVNKNKIYNKTFKHFTRFISCGILILMPLTLIVFSFIIGKNYNQAQNLIPLLYVGCFFEAVQNFLGSIMQSEKKVNLMFLSQIFGSLVTVIVFITTVNFLKIQAAGLSMLMCFLAVCFIRFKALKPKINLKFDLIYLLHYLPILILTIYVYYNYNITINLILFLILLVYCFFCTLDLIKKITRKISKKLLK